MVKYGYHGEIFFARGLLYQSNYRSEKFDNFNKCIQQCISPIRIIDLFSDGILQVSLQTCMKLL